jgi:hypothetical protein
MSLISFLMLKNIIGEKKNGSKNNLMKRIAEKTAKSILIDEAETKGTMGNHENNDDENQRL